MNTRSAAAANFTIDTLQAARTDCAVKIRRPVLQETPQDQAKCANRKTSDHRLAVTYAMLRTG